MTSIFVSDLYNGEDPEVRIPIRAIQSIIQNDLDRIEV